MTTRALTFFGLVLTGCFDATSIALDKPCPCLAEFVCCDGRCVPDGMCGIVDGPPPLPGDDGITPLIVAVEPSSGLVRQETRVTITGRNFGEDVQVAFDNSPCFNLVRLDETQIECTAPRGKETTSFVDVFATSGGRTGRLQDGYHYILRPFVEISQQTGLRTRTGGLSLATLDIDKDGVMDVFVPNTSESNPVGGRTFVQRGNWQFLDTQAPWLASLKNSQQAFLVDVDADGHEDLLTTVRSNGGAGTRMIKGTATGFDQNVNLLPSSPDSHIKITTLDLDGDRLLDIFMCISGSTNAQPERFKFYRNRGNGRFIDASNLLLYDEARYTARPNCTDVTTGDIEGDGRIDVIVCDTVPIVFQNSGGSLEDVSRQLDLPATSERPCRSIEAADLDHDGDQELLWVGEGALLTTHQREGPAPHEGGTVILEYFEDSYLPLPRMGDVQGSACLLHPGDAAPDRALDAGMHAVAVLDHDLDGDMDVFLPLPFARCVIPPTIYDNQLANSGVFRFDYRTITVGNSSADVTALAVADIDADGDPDVVSRAWGARGITQQYRNFHRENPSPNHFLTVRAVTDLDGDATDSAEEDDYFAGPVRVEIDLDGPVDAPDFAKGTVAYSSRILGKMGSVTSRPREAYFGTGTSSVGLAVRVFFSDGSVVTHRNLQADQVVTVRDCAAASCTN